MGGGALRNSRMCKRCDIGGISEWNKTGLCKHCQKELHESVPWIGNKMRKGINEQKNIRLNR